MSPQFYLDHYPPKDLKSLINTYKVERCLYFKYLSINNEVKNIMVSNLVKQYISKNKEKKLEYEKLKLKEKEKNFIKKAKKIHHVMNYDYSKVEYKSAKNKVIISCPTHGDFFVRPRDHITKKSGCPACAASKGEIKILEFLMENNIDFIHQHSFPDLLSDKGFPLLYDFYIKDLNLLIEFDGVQHFKFMPYFHKTREEFERQKKHDDLKNKYAKKNKYKLIRIKDVDKVYSTLSTVNF